mmetsp:Transcript_37396/g.97595  ORF Transcript_37396/g.97595 Transcript_37396/m.97595 type:complete len:302 (-) Transcript_37396:78-983(-)
MSSPIYHGHEAETNQKDNGEQDEYHHPVPLLSVIRRRLVPSDRDEHWPCTDDPAQGARGSYAEVVRAPDAAPDVAQNPGRQVDQEPHVAPPNGLQHHGGAQLHAQIAQEMRPTAVQEDRSDQPPPFVPVQYLRGVLCALRVELVSPGRVLVVAAEVHAVLADPGVADHLLKQHREELGHRQQERVREEHAPVPVADVPGGGAHVDHHAVSETGGGREEAARAAAEEAGQRELLPPVTPPALVDLDGTELHVAPHGVGQSVGRLPDASAQVVREVLPGHQLLPDLEPLCVFFVRLGLDDLHL